MKETTFSFSLHHFTCNSTKCRRSPPPPSPHHHLHHPPGPSLSLPLCDVSLSTVSSSSSHTPFFLSIVYQDISCSLYMPVISRNPVPLPLCSLYSSLHSCVCVCSSRSAWDTQTHIINNKLPMTTTHNPYIVHLNNFTLIHKVSRAIFIGSPLIDSSNNRLLFTGSINHMVH